MASFRGLTRCSSSPPLLGSKLCWYLHPSVPMADGGCRLFRVWGGWKGCLGWIFLSVTQIISWRKRILPFLFYSHLVWWRVSIATWFLPQVYINSCLPCLKRKFGHSIPTRECVIGAENSYKVLTLLLFFNFLVWVQTNTKIKTSLTKLHMLLASTIINIWPPTVLFWNKFQISSHFIHKYFSMNL